MPARLDAGAAKAIHEVAHGETLADRLGRVLLTARIEHDDLFRHQKRGEWHVRGDGDIAGPPVLDDIAVGDVGAVIDADGGDVRVAGRDLNSLVGNQNRLELQPIRRPNADVLDVAWRGVGGSPLLLDVKTLTLSTYRGPLDSLR